MSLEVGHSGLVSLCLLLVGQMCQLLLRCLSAAMLLAILVLGSLTQCKSPVNAFLRCCGGLNERSPDRLVYWNAWLPGSGTPEKD